MHYIRHNIWYELFLYSVSQTLFFHTGMLSSRRFFRSLHDYFILSVTFGERRTKISWKFEDLYSLLGFSDDQKF